MRNTIALITWCLFLIFGMIFSFIAIDYFPKSYTVSLGPNTVYSWIADSSEIKGDGQTVLYLKSEGKNFTVYDQNGLYVVTGQPVEMKPGDDKQTFTANFELLPNYTYTLSDTSADIFTLSPRNIGFESPRYGFTILGIIFLLMFAFTMIVL